MGSNQFDDALIKKLPAKQGEEAILKKLLRFIICERRIYKQRLAQGNVVLQTSSKEVFEVLIGSRN